MAKGAVTEDAGMDLELRHCRALVALADHGGITRAARALGVAQSTVSEALLALERAVGARVTVRGPGPAHLSPAGRALLPHARALLAGAEAALAAVAATRARAGLSVGAVESVSSYVLPDALAALRTRWPDADIQVATGLCDDLREAVARGRLHAALVLSAADGPGAAAGPSGGALVARALSPARLVLLGRGLDAGPVVTPLALGARGLVLPDAEGAFHDALRRWFDAARAPMPHVRSAGSIEGVKRALAVEGGILAVLPAHAVTADIARGDLVVPATTPELPAIRLEAVQRRTDRAGGPLADLLAMLERIDFARVPPNPHAR